MRAARYLIELNPQCPQGKETIKVIKVTHSAGPAVEGTHLASAAPIRTLIPAVSIPTI
jgi:hypothetical protein